MRELIYFFYRQVIKYVMFLPVSKIRVIHLFHNFVIKILGPEVIFKEGLKIILDPTDSLRLTKTKEDECLETKVIKDQIKKGDIVLDIGAHIGYYSLIFGKLVGSLGKVYAFEPAKDNFTLLKKNIRLNNFKNIVPIKKAVSDQDSKTSLLLSRHDSVDHRVLWVGKHHRVEIVTAVKLDNFFKKKTKVNLIKIDVQGEEFKVLKGCASLLKMNKQLKIITEFWPYGLSRSTDNPMDLLNFLIRQGFVLYNINEQMGKLEVFNAGQLLKRYNIKNKADTNLLCARP